MDNIIVTANGRRVEIQPVPVRFVEKQKALVEKSFREAGEPLDPPWYWSVEPDEKGEGGEKIFWDAASVAKDGTEEEKQAWAKHQEATNRLKAAQDLREQEVLLLRGIKNEEDKTPTPEWVKEQEYWGVELPTDPQKLALEYIQDQVLETLGDQVQALGKIMSMNMRGIAKNEEVEAFEATFQDAMVEALKREFGQKFSRPTGSNGAVGTEQVRDVDIQPAQERLESSEILGD